MPGSPNGHELDVSFKALSNLLDLLDTEVLTGPFENPFAIILPDGEEIGERNNLDYLCDHVDETVLLPWARFIQDNYLCAASVLSIQSIVALQKVKLTKPPCNEQAAHAPGVMPASLDYCLRFLDEAQQNLCPSPCDPQMFLNALDSETLPPLTRSLICIDEKLAEKLINSGPVMDDFLLAVGCSSVLYHLAVHHYLKESIKDFFQGSRLEEAMWAGKEALIIFSEKRKEMACPTIRKQMEEQKRRSLAKSEPGH